MPVLPEPFATALRDAPSHAVCVGYSGGVDSTVLLHALRCADVDVRALHIDHGLQSASGEWAEHCRRFCGAQGIELTVMRVHVDAQAALGPEGAARAARHAAFAAELRDGETLALAHHRDDQAETVLLRLLHGAGVEGLGGMRRTRTFARGTLWRPLLGIARDDIVRYARSHGLAWIEDPSNASPTHAARNHVRHVVMPTLQQRWPYAARRVASAAARVAEEADVLDALARETLAQLQVDGDDVPCALDAHGLRALAPALRRAIVGRWLDTHGLPRPPPGAWNELADLLDAREDAAPLWRWAGAEVRRYRDTLHAMRPLQDIARDWSIEWSGAATLDLPAGFGRLELDPPVTLDPPLHVRPRRGGERLAQPGVRRELRTLLQDLGLPPWERDRLPLLLDEHDTVVSAADLALAPALAARLAAHGTRLRWHRRDD